MEHSSPRQLFDSFQRSVSYLRLSVTDRCNLRCQYCAPTLPKPIDSARLLTLDEMLRLSIIGTRLGISKIRLTGGEPLCRNGLPGFIGQLSLLPDLQDICLTTNGTLLSQYARDLKKAGLGRINISLDTLDREKYARLTGADRFDTVWKGIHTAADLGFTPIKINTVVMKGFNDDEIESMARLSLKHSFHIRFIEYMPIGTDPELARRRFVPVSEIRKRLERIGRLSPVAGTSLDGPAQRFRFDGAPGEIGLIGSMSDHFCGTCNRLRLSANGQLRPCLLAEETVDVISPMREGATDEELASRFVHAIQHKRGKHRMGFTREQVLQTKMVCIGG